MKRKHIGTFIQWGILTIAVIMAVYTGLLLQQTARDPMETAVSKRTQISYSWWGNDPRHEYTLKGIDLFEERNPDIRVRPEYGVWSGYEYKNRVAMLSHTEQDVMQINFSWMKEYSKDGSGYYDLRKLGDIIDLSQFTGKDLEYCSKDGKLNGLPFAWNMPVFIYNKDLYDQYGLDLPRTYDDLFKAADVMSKDGIYPVAAVSKQAWLLLLAWYEQDSGKAAFSEDGTCRITVSGWEDILKFYKELLDRKVMPPVDEFAHQFEGQTAAGTLVWISDVDRYSTAMEGQANIQVGANVTKDGEGFEGWHMKPASLVAVSAITDHPEEAAKLADFLVNDPDFALMQGTEKGVPVSRRSYGVLDAADEMNPYQKEATDMLTENQDQITLSVPEVEDDEVIGCFKDEADRYIYGLEDLGRCAQNLVKGIAEIQRE